jgi:DNA-binding cell septation regulator SpoVG
MSEPKLGFNARSLVKTKKAGKVKAFFSLYIPTESLGTIELAGFKVVEGEKGLFISLPNRAVPVKQQVTVNTANGQVEGTTDEVKYFNNIRFESQDKYNEFRKELNDNVLPLIAQELQK